MFVGCSGRDEDKSTNQQTQYFHPPAWIQGTWKIEGTTTPWFTFTNDDFIQDGAGSMSYKNTLQQAAASGQQAKVVETITSDIYDFDIYVGGSNGKYQFKKISATKIEWVNGNMVGMPIYLVK